MQQQELLSTQLSGAEGTGTAAAAAASQQKAELSSQPGTAATSDVGFEGLKLYTDGSWIISILA